MATTKATTLAHTLGGISSDISTAEINRLDGVTGDLQTQLNAKAPTASPTFTGTITAPNNSISGAFVTDETILIEFILIGGGGPGGIDRGGGGGAGGYIRKRTVVQKGVAYTIDIGNGGASRSGSAAPVNGENSKAFGYIALGGGCGGTYHGNGSDSSKKGQSGGSGGGTSNMAHGYGGGGAAGQGNSGGNFNSNVANNSCGGGGGAGGQGQPASTKGGDGGLGITDNWEGSNISRAGGGGGASGSGTAGSGKSGGGNGSTGDGSGSGGDASANSGSGGGGATGGGGGGSGAGGSGICLIRNLATLGEASITGTGNDKDTRTIDSISYVVYKFIADGTITF